MRVEPGVDPPRKNALASVPPSTTVDPPTTHTLPNRAIPHTHEVPMSTPAPSIVLLQLTAEQSACLFRLLAVAAPVAPTVPVAVVAAVVAAMAAPAEQTLGERAAAIGVPVAAGVAEVTDQTVAAPTVDACRAACSACAVRMGGNGPALARMRGLGYNKVSEIPETARAAFIAAMSAK